MMVNMMPRFLAFAVSLLLLAGCSSGPAQVVTVTAAPASESPDPNVITTPTPTPPVTSERGHAVVGEAV